jgi:hypothetical protein
MTCIKAHPGLPKGKVTHHTNQMHEQPNKNENLFNRDVSKSPLRGDLEGLFSLYCTP